MLDDRLRPLAQLRRPLPSTWRLLWAGDTGTYMSAACVAFPPDTFDAYVLAEFPNYRYVGGEIELLGESIPEWARVVTTANTLLTGSARVKGWCDENSQFKTELQNYNIHWQGNSRQLELRVEIAREYFQNRRVWMAPWLSVLPYELEHAVWPDDTNSAGRFNREKTNDHTLDCLEHILSRRPRHKHLVARKGKSFLQQQFDQHAGWRLQQLARGDIHLGPH